jgi:hypothetical protein
VSQGTARNSFQYQAAAAAAATTTTGGGAAAVGGGSMVPLVRPRLMESLIQLPIVRLQITKRTSFFGPEIPWTSFLPTTGV